MGVRVPAPLKALSSIIIGLFSWNADHTKYIGKSAGHKHDVKFSEDGETVLEGEDVE